MEDNEYQTILDKLNEVSFQNKQLRRANINKSKTIKYLRRVIKSLKEDAAKDRKVYYQNGRRGSRFNG